MINFTNFSQIKRILLAPNLKRTKNKTNVTSKRKRVGNLESKRVPRISRRTEQP